MTVRNMVGNLARTGVSTAVSVVRHPISGASRAAGLFVGVAQAGAHVVHNAITGQPDPPTGDESDRIAAEAAIRPTDDPAPDPVADPAPDPAPEDPPEPIVIAADPR